jgi:hypothetical protein
LLPEPNPHLQVSRREAMRKGAKLVFVAPVLSTFFAHDAFAAGSRHSCYPAGHPCGVGHNEECCPGLTCEGVEPMKTCM